MRLRLADTRYIIAQFVNGSVCLECVKSLQMLYPHTYIRTYVLHSHIDNDTDTSDNRDRSLKSTSTHATTIRASWGKVHSAMGAVAAVARLDQCWRARPWRAAVALSLLNSVVWLLVQWRCRAGQLFADPQAMTTAGLATLMPGAKLDAHALTQPLLLGATTHARPGKNAAGGDVGAAFGKLSVMDADAMAPGAYSGHTTKAPRGGAAAGTAKAKGVSKRGGGDGSSGNANKSRQLPPLQSNTPAPQV